MSTVAIVTGASRGIGLEIVRQLAAQPPKGKITIFATARDPSAVKASVSDSDEASVQWHALDISSESSIASFADHVLSQCPDGVSVLINNAGVNVDMDGPHGIEPSTKTIRTNYDGTLLMMKTFLPHLQSQGRIVNVSSVGSKLSNIPDQKLRQRIRHASSLDEIATLRGEYLDSVADGSDKAKGWPQGRAYSVSKSLINAATQVLAAEHKNISINACCPGWCSTDMGGLMGRAPKSPADGAKIPLNLAFGDIQGVSGAYWENSSISDTGTGKPSEWL